MTIECASRSAIRCIASSVAAIERAVWTTALGAAVVPEVNTIKTGSSARNRAGGAAEAADDDMSSRASRVKPLGSYRVVFQAMGASSTLDLSTIKGPLLLSGHGKAADGASSFQGEASATPDQRDNLAGLLNLLGSARETGSVALNFQAR